MDKKIYEAIKKRVSVVPLSEVDEESRANMRCSEGCIIYLFNATGLLDKEGKELFSIMHPMHTKNMWNVCQFFYSVFRYYTTTKELLK